MEIAEIGPWVATVALLVSLINTVSIWVSNPARVAKERHEELKKEVTNDLKAHDRRIQALEDTDKHSPTKEDLHELALKMEALTAKLGGLDKTVDRMDRHLRGEK